MPSLSSWLFLGLVVAALLDAFAVPGAETAAVGCLALFILLEVRFVAWPQLLIAGALIVAGLAAAASAPDSPAFDAILQTLGRGLKAALPFLVLFAAVAWLTVPALDSPSLRAARDTVASQPPGWRFATLALAAHLLGSVFNLVVVSLLAILIGKQEKPATRRRLARALLQGFATGTAWSPLFVGTAVILAILPDVRWVSIAPYGAGIALALLMIAWLADRLLNPARAPINASVVPLPPEAALRLALLVGALLVGVIGLVELTGFSIPIVLGLLAPPFAVLWRANRRILSALDSAADVARKVVTRLSDLRTETLMFTAANTFSAGVARAVPDARASEAIGLLGLGSDGLVAAFALGLIGASALGLHPVIAVVMIGTVIPPEIFGLPLPLLALFLMALWGMGTNVSPFSATNIIMGRAVGVGHWHIAWRWNLPFSLGGAAVVAGIVIVLRHVLAG
jgi:hypothetical protein